MRAWVAATSLHPGDVIFVNCLVVCSVRTGDLVNVWLLGPNGDLTNWPFYHTERVQLNFRPPHM